MINPTQSTKRALIHEGNRKGLLKTFCLWTLILSFTLLVFSLTITKVTNNDIWWQLKTGEIILKEKALPRIDPYSCVAEGRPWINHEWLSEVIFHLADRLGGTTALILLKCLMVFAICLVVLAHARLYPSNVCFTIPVLVLALYVSTAGLYVRPHLFTYLFLVFCIFLMERSRRLRNRPLPWVLIPIMLIWANLHGGFIAGLAVVSLYALGRIIEYGIGRMTGKNNISPSVIRWSLIITGLLYLVALLNPHGYRAYLYFFELRKSKIFLQNILEWQPTFTSSFTETYTFIYYCIYAAIAGLSLIAARKKLHPGMVLAFAFLFYLSISMNRNVGTFAIATAGLVAANWNAFWYRRRQRRSFAMCCVFFAVILTALSYYNATRGFAVSGGLNRRPGFGVDLGKRGTAGARFLEDHRVEGRVFNAYAFGGDLIYQLFPRCRPAMDSRNEVYGRPLFLAYSRALADPDKFREYSKKYRLNIIFLQYPDPRKDYPLHRSLHNDPVWQLVYFDDAGLIYLKNEPPFRRTIREKSYRYLHPLLFSPADIREADFASFIEEAKKAVAAASHSQIARSILVNIMTRSGAYEEARLENARLLDLDRYSYRYHLNEGMIALLEGRKSEARRAFRKALDRHPTSVAARRYLEMIENE